MHKDPGKPSTKPPKRIQTSHRTGVRTPNGETKSWFRSPKPVKKSNIRDVEIRPISASTPTLNNNNESKKSSKRPLTFAAGNVTLRRGQQTSKIETATTPDDLSRSSSITNLNADPKATKGAKPKKAESKDKLDKVTDKKNDKKALNKNNNKESEGSTDSEVETLQKQLAQMANDKTNLALQLGEQNGHIHKLQEEVKQLKMMHQEAEIKVEQLMDENSVLRKQLRDVANSPLSDNEKQQILYETHRQHSSAPASIATNLLDDSGDITACPTPEWDKHSSSNVSEVSVACLQDKIHQMQETHYSTNEELQATLQELTDLQKQLTELQQENLRLSDEKNLMFESLCRQTERLNDSRNEVESLKQLLYNDENGQFETAAEREQKLVDLLKKAQEEREALLVKQEQLGNELEDARSGNLIQNEEIGQLSERVKTLESTLDAKHAEHKQLDQELAQAKDQSSSRQIEINRLKDLLENARTKIGELEQDRTLSDKSELDELLDNARKEKDALESEVAHLKEQLALSKNETEKLREQVSILQEECKVTRNNAKTTQSDLEYKLEKLQAEKVALTEQLQEFQDAVNELQVQAQCQTEDKRQLSAVLSETQRNLNESERKIVELENELTELKRVKADQEEEWEKFQKDLLTSVRVANDFKTEAQQDLEKLVMENKAGRERIKQLEAQLEKLKGPSRKSNFDDKIASLNRRYKQIEGLTDEQLSEEQRAVKLLKEHYDRDLPKRKPVANKPKDKLAISKPSLESVVSDPKLHKFVRDSKLQNVETAYFYDEEVQSEPEVQKPSKSIHVRSKSLSDLPEPEPRLRRYDSIENLLDLSSKPKVRKPRKKSTITNETLERICREIDPNIPEDELTKEQRFALRLRKVLNKEQKKVPVKKHPNFGRKKLKISRPTQESVIKNETLRRIINDPVIRNVGPENRVIRRSKVGKKGKGRYSAPVSPPIPNDSLKIPKSKSYNDIHFKFQVPDMYCGDEERSEIPVLPPEEFRDTEPSMAADNSAFRTFHVDKNTFKREHNYLDEDVKKKIEDEDYMKKKIEEEHYLDEEVTKKIVDEGEDVKKKIEEEHYADEDVRMKIEDENCVDDGVKKKIEDEVYVDEDVKKKIKEELHVDEKNTFKREHNYLDEDVKKKIEDEDYMKKKIEEEHYGDEEVTKKIVDEVYVDEDVRMKIEDENCVDEDVRKKIEDENCMNDDVWKKIEDENCVDEDVKKKVEDEYYVDKDVKKTIEDVYLDENMRKKVEDVTDTINNVIIERFYEEDLLNDDLNEEDIKVRRGTRQRYSQVIEEMKEKFDISDNEEDQTEENTTFKAVPAITVNDSDSDEFLLDEELIRKKKIIELADKNVEEPPKSLLEFLEPSTDRGSFEFHEEITFDDEEMERIKANYEEIPKEVYKGIYFEEEDIVKVPKEEFTIFVSQNEDATPTSTVILEEAPKEQMTIFMTLKPESTVVIEEITEQEEDIKIEPSSCLIIEETHNFILKERDASDESANKNEETEEINEIMFVIPTKDQLSIEELDDQVVAKLNEDEEIDDKVKRKENLEGDNKRRERGEENDQQTTHTIKNENDLLNQKIDEGELSEEKGSEFENENLNKTNEDSCELREDLTPEELEILHQLTKPRVSRPLSDLKDKDLELIEKFKAEYKSEETEEENVKKPQPPRILSPTKLNEKPSYEPVYANYSVVSSNNRSSKEFQASISGKKPVALPRVTSLDTEYHEFSGQVRKTRFSITYERKKGDSFKEKNEEKSTKVKDLKEMFERRSNSGVSPHPSAKFPNG
ncbi:COP1-interactive protein 1-like isoform X2 [Tribolium madens]|uniref:COP1-interactive protein 1-like isoform X2 n=1 Tax=Tribolium madens TaxID=41895 RepID=UPI001CF733ED|nr:COP1-interactive protein 1-like isoform X2 [Tribolium madens]XP_044261249.1 COP1-interactive protein 1-like isoform X2 [Tribolium madens]XP_044261250.1 COP1-interactive protein 1-like isoform X2 [Tribolium madens]